MSSGKIENQLLDAIETVVNNAVAKANYDRTVQAVVVRCENEASGKYTVKYQDSLMYAYSPDLNSIYPNGTPVYVLIPGNDTGLNKQIIGSVSRIGEDYLDNINEENAYEYNGKNCIENSDSFGLCSYTNGGQVIVLYDKESGINQIGLNTTDAEVYLKTSDYLICGGYVQTNLNLEQQYAGNYGMCFELTFKDNSTGELVTRNYLMDVDQMHGNPYQLNASTRQSGIFEIDGENFDSINKIYIFEKGFPNIASGKPNDIFISALELYGASLAPKDENANCNLTLLTPQGIYFDDTYLDSDKISLQAQVRAKGSVINPTSETLEYYWFVENNSIVYTSEGYSKIGGAGWECLNPTTDLARKTDWAPSSYVYEITKWSVPARKTRFKCVVCYNKNTYVSREIVVYNYSSPYEITIESSRGTQFYYDLGETNLTCLVNGEDRSSGQYSYVWSVVNNVGSFASLNGSEDYNIDKNKINNLPINTIVNHSTYKCTAFLNGVNIGVGTITINNSLEGGNSYSLIINNGSQVFKYDEQGVSPADNASINPIEILPLGFTLYDNTGEEIPHTAIKGEDIRWIIPSEDTMIKVLSAYGEPTFETETTYIYTNTYDMGFSISPTYYSRKLNNTIILEVSYKDNLFIAKTDLTFLKEGESGTNGTEFVCRILPNVAEGDVPRYPMVTYDEDAETYKLNYTAYSSRKWFRVNLWHNGELIYSGTETGTSTETAENNDVSVSWEILRNRYDSTNVDNSNFIINGQTGEITLNPEDYISINNDPANIVKCTIRYQGVTYYATLPIIFARVANSDYEIKLKDNTGFIYSMYTTDGRNPQYDNSNPFEIEVYKEGIEITKNSELGYTWFNLGTYYLGEWQPSQNLIERSSAGLEKNQRKYKPSDTNSGLCVSNAVYCAIGDGNTEIGSIHIPVHMYLNRYGNAALNGWDGNSISIDEDKGIILSPIVGAGEKDPDNGFTGVLMGTVAEAGAEKTETGLFGYNNGTRTITLSAEDGSARFGSEGAGQIIIDPNDGPEGHAYLRSGNFELAYTRVASTDEYSEFGMYFRKENDNYRLLRKDIDYTPGAQVREPNIYRMAPGGSGLEIDLTDPHIVFGSGDFRVDSDGRVYASQYATANMSFDSSSVIGLDSKLESVDNSISDLQDSINYLEVTIPTTAIQIETDTERKPVRSNTYTLECVSLYKGEVVQPTRVNSTGSYQGISLVSTSYDSSKGATIITFYVESKTALENAINTYEFEFIYNRPGCKPVKKEISVNAVIKGADGTSVTIKGSYTNIAALCTDKSSGNQPGDGYILEDNSIPPTGEGEDGHLFIYTNAGGGNGSLPEDWRDVGKFRGQDGVNGRGIQAITYTYLVNNSSIKPDVDDAGWRSVMNMPDENNRYLWQKEVITYLESNGTTTTQTTILLLAVDGKAGVGVRSTEIKYQESVSGTIIPSEDGWVDNPPEVPLGHYLWSRIKVSYTDNRDPDISYTIAYSGTNGEDSTNIICGNEADSIVCGNDEKTSAASTITIPFEGYVGKRKVACTVAATGLPTGITVKTNTAATSTTRGSLVLNVASGSTLGGAKSGTITLTFTCNSLTFIKYFTWFKVIKGDTGPSGYNNAQVFLYQRATSAPSVPSSTTTYTFSTHSLSGTLGSWTQTIPTGTEPLYVTVATANANAATDTIAANEWCTPFIQADLSSGISISAPRQQFIYTDGTPDVTSITLTATSTGTWYYFNGTSYVAANLTADTIDVAHNSSYFNGDVARFKVTATINGKSCEDYYSLYKIYNGTNGESPDPISTIFLTNENVSFPADKDGKLKANVVFNCNVVAYTGTTKVTPTVGTISGGVTNKLTITKGSATTGKEIPLTITGISGTDLGGDSGEISVPITSPVNTTLKITWSKINTGATGQQGTAGINTATLYAYKRSATEPSIDWSSAITYTFSTSAWNLPSGSTWSKSIAAGSDPLYMVTATAASNTATDTVAASEWSAPVKVMENGAAGTSPYIGYLTNESHTFAYGTAKDVTTQLYAYQGTTEKAVTIKTVNGKTATTTTAETGKTGMNFKVSSTGSVSHPTITFSSTSSLPQTQSEQLNIVYRIAGESVDRTLSFSYSTTTQGAGGAAASLVDITASSQVFKSNDGGRTFSPNVITLTPRFQTVAYSKWQYSTNGGSSWTNVSSGSHGLTISNQILTVANNSDLYTTTTSSVIFRCMSNNTSIFDTLSIVRLYDVGDIQIGGCNLARETKSFEVGEDLWSIGSGFTRDIDDEGFTTISFSRTGSTTPTWTRAIPHKYLTIDEINNYAKSGITVSFDLKVENKDAINQGVLCALQTWQNETTRVGWYEGANIITGAQYDEPLSAWTNGVWKRAKVHFSLANLKQVSEPGKTEADINFTNVSFQLVRDGSISIKKVKIEYGNIATDWTPAPEDVDNDIGDAQVVANNASGNAATALEGIGTLNNQVITINGQLAGIEGLANDLKKDIDRNYANSIKETYVEYCQINYTFNPVAVDTAYNEAEVYYQQGGSTGAYVYSKIRPTIEDGKVKTACYTKVSPLRQPEDTDVWNRSKPTWRDGTGTYQRTTVVYQDGTTEHSTPFLTEDYQTVDDLRYIDASRVLADMRGKNKIFYNDSGFYCYDVNNEGDSKHRIILNNEGILFGVKKDSGWKDTSVWKIDGVFNAENIVVKGLNAESISDGILTLGNSSKDGELRILDDAGAERIELNSQRAIYYLNNGGYVLIGKDIGIQVLDADKHIQFGSSLAWTSVTGGNYQNNINYYEKKGELMTLITPERTGAISGTVWTVTSGNIFEAKQQKVNTSVNFGDLIQTININATDSAGKLHKGVGFVAKL